MSTLGWVALATGAGTGVVAMVHGTLAIERRAGVHAAVALAALALTLVLLTPGAASRDGFGAWLALGASAALFVACAVTVRRFLSAHDRLEALNARLGEEVEERSQALRRRELQLAHGDQLATLGTLAAGLAQEINDPLAFVGSSLNRLEELWHDPAASAEVREILSECSQGVERLSTVVAQLLLLARRGEGRREAVDLRAVVASILPLVRLEARFRGRLVERLEPVPSVLGERRLLGQVVLQLLLYAIRSLPEGGVQEHEIAISTRACGEKVVLAIEDDGPEISAAELERLFDPFAVGIPGRRAPGLGLAVTRQIVQQMGGSIRAESSAGRTRLLVELPAQADAGAARAKPELARGGESRYR